MIPPEQSEGNLRSIYDTIEAARKGIANILQIQSLNPPSLKAHFDLYRTTVLGKSSLSRTRREMIAVVVSVLNRCHY
jgi:alkylhydroperoxidase family enzyme